MFYEEFFYRIHTTAKKNTFVYIPITSSSEDIWVPDNNFSLSVRISTKSKPQKEGCDCIWGDGHIPIGKKGPKGGPKQAFFEFQDNNLCLSIFIARKLYYKVQYHT